VRARLVTSTVILGLLASQVVMFGVMIARHPPVYELIDHRYWYYPLPFQAMVFAGLSLLFARGIRDWIGTKRAAAVGVIALMIAGNLAHWTMYRDRMLTSRWFSLVHPQSALLKKSLETGTPDPGLILPYQQFYEFCRRLRSGLDTPSPPTGGGGGSEAWE